MSPAMSLGTASFLIRGKAGGSHSHSRSASRPLSVWTRALSASLALWTTGGVYVNAIGGDVTEERKLAAFGGREQIERLRELKRAWDPDNLFHRNHNVAP
jgi:FAD/FMN-containing dehydrogenase